MIAHIVLFEPKAGITSAQKRLFAQLMRRVRRAVPAIERAVVGRAVHADPGYARSFGGTTYSYAAIVEFADQKGLIEYLTHPLHQELGALFWEACERTAIVEVETRTIDDDLDDLLVEDTS